MTLEIRRWVTRGTDEIVLQMQRFKQALLRISSGRLSVDLGVGLRCNVFTRGMPVDWDPRHISSPAAGRLASQPMRFRSLKKAASTARTVSLVTSG